MDNIYHLSHAATGLLIKLAQLQLDAPRIVISARMMKVMMRMLMSATVKLLNSIESNVPNR
ncbi:hypothetical protein ZHAS_00004750 [Anopheles sinensis]|uniref:Uncharacterized protein n=1 Tax=Anopheles sinensis TaxID=74873 RepID=A0A084VHS3_ANOSI|nr:hypothetical protein ZHAS_00004750 [Anopheles sinensis]